MLVKHISSFSPLLSIDLSLSSHLTMLPNLSPQDPQSSFGSYIILQVIGHLDEACFQFFSSLKRVSRLGFDPWKWELELIYVMVFP
jgi:hypothetical protein